MSYWLRFTGDPTGYRLPDDLDVVTTYSTKPVWIDAYVGNTNRKVRVDASKAYLVEEGDDFPSRRDFLFPVARAHIPSQEES